MRSYEELFAIATRLKEAANAGEADAITKPIEALEQAARTIGRSFSGSWLGYHSRVYYKDLAVPPPGAHFSQEWGLKDMSYTSLGSRGDWREYDADAVKAHIREIAGEPQLDKSHQASEAASRLGGSNLDS